MKEFDSTSVEKFAKEVIKRNEKGERSIQFTKAELEERFGFKLERILKKLGEHLPIYMVANAEGQRVVISGTPIKQRNQKPPFDYDD